MQRNGRTAEVLLLACTFTFSLCSAAAAGSEPNAAELVRAVRESENWLHRIDSLRLRIEGKWSHPPESVAARYAKLKKQSPDQEPDPNSNWDLKPSISDILESRFVVANNLPPHQSLLLLTNLPGLNLYPG